MSAHDELVSLGYGYAASKEIAAIVNEIVAETGLSLDAVIVYVETFLDLRAPKNATEILEWMRANGAVK